MMTHRFVAFGLLLCFGQVDAQLVEAAPACAQDCLTILQTGVAWLLEDQSYSPDEIVLDTAASGILRVQGEPSRFIDPAILDQLAMELGINQDTRERVLVCSDDVAVGDVPCRIRGANILMVVNPPRPLPEGNRMAFEVRVTGMLYTESPWATRVFRLTLERIDRAWLVVDRRLVGMS